MLLLTSQNDISYILQVAPILKKIIMLFSTPPVNNKYIIFKGHLAHQFLKFCLGAPADTLLAELPAARLSLSLSRFC
jgi:hypothetical protein